MSQKPSNSLKQIEQRMNQVLQRLGLNFRVQWLPSPEKEKHGNIDLKERVIHIFDVSEHEAWQTLLHEVLEIKFRKVTSLYQKVVNSLISLLEGQVYREKEAFLETLPVILSQFEKAKKEGLEDA